MPVYNGRRRVRDALAAIDAQRDGRPFEVIAVDDGSSDGSRRILDDAALSGDVRVVDGPGRGIAAALNAGIREARHPIICQVDQDVVISDGWLAPLVGPGGSVRCRGSGLTDVARPDGRGYGLDLEHDTHGSAHRTSNVAPDTQPIGQALSHSRTPDETRG